MKDCPFFGVPVKKNERKCLGIKHCEYAAADFVNQRHQYVDFESETFKNMMIRRDNNTTQSKIYL